MVYGTYNYTYQLITGGHHLVQTWNIWLVGGFNLSEKKLVSWDDYSQYMEK